MTKPSVTGLSATGPSVTGPSVTGPSATGPVKTTNQYGDFQTPLKLANDCVRLAMQTFGRFDCVVEPTCGRGAFLMAAVESCQDCRHEGFEFQDRHVRAARRNLKRGNGRHANVHIRRQDFFSHDWRLHRDSLRGSVLYLGNPPWVTNAALGSIASTNVPAKTNIARVGGLLAMTGGGNFDLSESILQTLLPVMRPGIDALAMLVKKSTVRVIAKWAWTNSFRFAHLSTHTIDTKDHFDVRVDACWMMIRLAPAEQTATYRCVSYPCISSPLSSTAFGWHSMRLVRDPAIASQTDSLLASQRTAWRSGVKHDAASVLVLKMVDGRLQNGLGEVVDIEPDRVHPLAKGSDIANGRSRSSDKFLLVPQRFPGECTERLTETLPRTMAYLNRQADRFAKRRSSIYQSRDRFAVFGVGPYTFAPWKVAVAGLYKRLTFTLVEPANGHVVVLDDTAYSLGFQTRRQARLIHQILSDDVCTDFLNARIFWDAKRPINSAVLGSLDLRRAAEMLDLEDAWARCFDGDVDASTFGQG